MPSRPGLRHLTLLRYLTTSPLNIPPICKPYQDSLLGPSHQLQNAPHFSHNTLYLHLGSAPTLQEARKLHALLLVTGYIHHQNHSPVLGSKLVNTYVTLGCLPEALLVFNQLPRRNAFSWNSILRGLVDTGRFSEAIDSYHMMMREGLVPDNFTYPLVLVACSRLSALEQGRKVYESINSDAIGMNSKPNIYVQCALVDMFAKCGSLCDARRVFDDMPTRDRVSWGAIICGTMRYGDWSEAMRLFRRMRLEGFGLDSIIVATILPACGRVGALQSGMGLHCCAVKGGFDNDLFVSNALIDMYCKCGYTQIARLLFGFIEDKDVVTWSSLIAGYSQNCEYLESLDLYVEMMQSGISPSPVTIASVLPSFAELKLFKQGKEIHSYAIRCGFESDAFVASALVDLYCQCGLMREAELIFQIMPDGDIAIANSMIAGYALNGDVDFAFKTLRKIRRAGLRPNSITIMTVVPLCNHFTMLSQGKELHGYVTRGGLESVVPVNNALIDMYCKCGHLELGITVFEWMIERDVVTYNTIIAAFGMHGHGEQAISFFEFMKEERIEPDKVTFIALLSACSHARLVERGLSFYHSMTNDYGILPDMEHYSCIVDLYGRSGYLEHAWKFIGKMPVEPDIDVLGSLMGACRVQKRIDLAELIGQMIFEKKPEDPGYHILLSNIYTAAGRWADATKVRAMIKEWGLMKKPGISWIQVGCCIHLFLARDRSHPEIDKIHEIMDITLLQMKDEGYIPDLSFSRCLSCDDNGIHDD